MGIANKYNKGSKFNFTIPQDMEYKSLHDLFNDYGKDKVFTVRAIFINKKSKFGESPIIATDMFLVNCPKHMVDSVKEMLIDDDVITAVNNGELGFTVYPYNTKNTSDVCYGLTWVDIDVTPQF
jgi:hypothetical protein